MYSKEFLKKLFEYPNQTTFARIISLDWQEHPMEELSGEITDGGTINIDGASSVRRSCSLSFITDKKEITDVYWSVKTKFRLEIGLRNNIDKNLPDIIWFPQGVYCITSFSYTLSTNSATVSLSGQDKMSLLNGSLGGKLVHQTDFGTIEEQIKQKDDSDPYITLKKIPIKNIIHNTLVQYAGERPENIVINDLDEYGYNLEKYVGTEESPLYYFQYTDGSERIINATFNGNMEVTVVGEGSLVKLSEITNYKRLAPLLEDDDIDFNATKVTLHEDSENEYYVIKIDSMETAGWRPTELVYGQDLILNVGEPLTNVFDKLVAQLGEFEYFYDIDGRFVFQKKKNYLQELLSPISKDGSITPIMDISQFAWEFDSLDGFTNVSSAVTINNKIYNDFGIWGAKQGVTGGSIPIHGRFAIDTKPTEYHSIHYRRAVEGDLEKNFDFYIKNQTTGFKYVLMPKPESLTDDQEYYVEDDTIVYTTENYDWRELIYQMAIDFFQHNEDVNFGYRLMAINPFMTSSKTGYEQYYADIQGFWRQIYNPNPDEEEKDKFNEKTHWSHVAEDNPENLIFWFDFLEPAGELKNVSVPVIGSRSFGENKSDYMSIYNRNTPGALIVNYADELQPIGQMLQDHSPIYIYDDMEDLFAKAAQGVSIVERANQLLQEACAQQSLTITSVPVYNLEPNVRIQVSGDEVFSGEYVVTRLSLPLSYNGTMQITAQQVVKELF